MSICVIEKRLAADAPVSRLSVLEGKEIYCEKDTVNLGKAFGLIKSNSTQQLGAIEVLVSFEIDL